MPNLVMNGYPTFKDIDGDPLEDGYIFIGEAGLNPIANPLQAYWDAALTIPAINIRTKGGYPIYNGSPSRLYVASNYSIQVQDKRNYIVYTQLDSVDYFNSPAGQVVLQVETMADLLQLTPTAGDAGIQAFIGGFFANGDGGGDIFYWDPSKNKANHDGGLIIDPDNPADLSLWDATQQAIWFTPGVGSGCWVRTVTPKPIYPEVFGAVGDGVHDDTLPIQATINALTGGGGSTTANGKATYLISSPLEIPNRTVSGSSYRTFDFNGAIFKQNTDDTPIFILRPRTTNITLRNFVGDYTNTQLTSSLNGTVVQFAPGIDPSDVGKTIWDSVIENIYCTNNVANMISCEDEDSSICPVTWGMKFRKIYGFPTRRAFYHISDAGGSVANEIDNCLFYGLSTSGLSVSFVELQFWTNCKISHTECLSVDTNTDIMVLNGCSAMTLENLRFEACALNTDETAFIRTTGSNYPLLVRSMIIANSVIAATVTNRSFGINIGGSKAIVDDFEIQGSTSLEILGGNFFCFYTALDGSIEYDAILSNVETVYPGSNIYLYREDSGVLTNHENVIGRTERVYVYPTELDGSASLAALPGFVNVSVKGYLAGVRVILLNAPGTDTFPKVYLNGVEIGSMSLLSAAKSGRKYFQPYLKNSIAVDENDIIQVYNNNLGVAETSAFVQVKILEAPFK